jgi:hypothetical protein
MKAIGKLIVGIDDNGREINLWQFDEIPSTGPKFKCEVGDLACDALENVWVKSGIKDNQWKSTVKRVMLLGILDWFCELAVTPIKKRNEALKYTKGALEVFKKGEKSPEGKQLVDSIDSGEIELIGFCPSVNYTPVPNSKGLNDVGMYHHPFSEFTLLGKVKNLPMLVIVSANIDYNTSRLIKNRFSTEKDEVVGITG